MSDPAVIAAKLVSMKNVGTHKSVVLTIHVPEELALRVIQAFGWPTMASPVDVAIAALDRESIKALTIEHETPVGVGASVGQGEEIEGGAATITQRASPALTRGPDERTWELIESRTPWDKLTPTQQAGMRCKDQEFWDFLSGDDFLIASEDEAARYVRTYCKVEGRAELSTNPEAARRWRHLDNLFLLRPKKSGTA